MSDQEEEQQILKAAEQERTSHAREHARLPQGHDKSVLKKKSGDRVGGLASLLSYLANISAHFSDTPNLDPGIVM